jgi:hypothetical protein
MLQVLQQTTWKSFNNLFDHLVGASEQHRPHVVAKRLGGLQVDGQLKLGWLPHRNLPLP